VKLQRLILGAAAASTPTLGTLTSNDGSFRCVTLERPADGDHPCVPARVYTVAPAVHHPGSEHPYPCPELDTEAVHRTHVQIHVANRLEELLGCIAPGERIAGIAIEDSAAAFDRLMAFLKRTWPWTLEILNPPAAS
jgi:hypothetical protein